MEYRPGEFPPPSKVIDIVIYRFEQINNRAM